MVNQGRFADIWAANYGNHPALSCWCCHGHSRSHHSGKYIIVSAMVQVAKKGFNLGVFHVEFPKINKLLVYFGVVLDITIVEYQR